MTEANDPSVDYRELVRAGYDSCADSYAAARCGDDSDQVAPLLEVLPDGSSVLDLGCGAGVPIARRLSERHSVTGVDTSEAMLRLARANVPDVRFIHGDIIDVELTESSFDAAVAIFVLFHLPREEHGYVFERVWSWLRPGGCFLVTLTEHAEAPYIEHDFFGTDMYWSNWALADYRSLLVGLGFEIVHERIVGHGYGRTSVERDERHPMLLVRKPGGETDWRPSRTHVSS
ncbi:MAG: class I SAM-dependent methyltransferase [Armatimonadetes bacterium]|nr:class I SAM-dependent methyltransferase [Armatimonadota bacterium]